MREITLVDIEECFYPKFLINFSFEIKIYYLAQISINVVILIFSSINSYRNLYFNTYNN